MITAIEQHLYTVRKSAWIDSVNRIVSFQKMTDASCFTAAESDFWTHIMELVNVGYRLQ